MPAFPVQPRIRHDLLVRRCLLVASVAALLTLTTLEGAVTVAGRTEAGSGLVGFLVEPAIAIDHLVVSELMTGGTSASDEFVELYNPSAAAISLDGLELVYVTASGATVTRKASWTADDPALPPGGHLLVANEAGIYAAAADAVYASGLSATGGSVALRAAGADSAVDAVGWGSAVSMWLEGAVAPSPAAGHSLERLPGGSQGSGQDTDQNAIDFVERDVPDPQGLTSEPIPAPTPPPMPTATPGATSTPVQEPTPTLPPPTAASSPTATPLPTATPVPTPVPTATPIQTPIPTGPTSAAIPIADARALADGSWVTVEGVSLTDGSFTDGGGYLADASGGIAVLVSDGTFPRGMAIRVSGELDDRYHQRTIRCGAGDLIVIGPDVEPSPVEVATGELGEPNEGAAVLVEGQVASAKTQLSSGLAFDLDDGSGPVRVLVAASTGIDTAAMLRGTSIRLVGVLGQRDSSGTGTEGYRVQPRDAVDILELNEPTPVPSTTPSPSTGGMDEPITIAQARLADVNARVRVRGVVTLPTAILGDGTAALQDETGAIVLRLGDEAGQLVLGELLIVDGMRSTKSGMETIRVSDPPLRIGHAGQPVPTVAATGEVGEGLEGHLVVTSGSVTAGPQRTSAQNVYFDVDDGSGPLRVFLTPGAGIDAGAIVPGGKVEVVGVVGQETTGQQPLRGYRIWPRSSADIRAIGGEGVGTGGGVGWSLAPKGATPSTASAEASRSGIPLAMPDLPVPRLVAGVAAGSSRSPDGAAAPGPDAKADGAGDPTPVAPIQMALLAVVIAGAAGTIAAHRPGLVLRVRQTLSRLATVPSALVGDEPTDEAARTATQAAAARLVPLRVVEGLPHEGSGSAGDRTAPRSGRILPPI